MAKQATKAAAGNTDTAKASSQTAVKAAAEATTADFMPTHGYCGMPDEPVRRFDNVHPGRAAAILDNDRKWVSGTNLRYYLFGENEFPWDRSRFAWGGDDAQRAAVRAGFAVWNDLNLGLTFEEVASPTEAEIRIGFVHGDGSWSWLGRRILDEPTNARTMNFGWDISNDIDTVVHEIGHTAALPHEHQNPFSGIVWDEEAVYADLGGPPNNWPRQKTFNNILRKLPESSVSGSQWDPNSIMHYPFKPGLILMPERYNRTGLRPNPGLSTLDKRKLKEWYPRVRSRLPTLEPFVSERVAVAPGEQVHFLIEPSATRDYTLQTFGASDTVMVLFEQVDGDWRFVDGDDDSGFDHNAQIQAHLFRDRIYAVRLRLYWAGESGDFGVVLY